MLTLMLMGQQSTEKLARLYKIIYYKKWGSQFVKKKQFKQKKTKSGLKVKFSKKVQQKNVYKVLVDFNFFATENRRLEKCFNKKICETL